MGLGTSLGFLAAGFLAFLLVGLPALSVAQVRLIGGDAIEPIPAYVSSIGAILVLGVVSVVLGARRFGTEAIGLVGLPVARAAIWVAVLLALAAVLLAGFWWLGRALGLSERPLLRQLLPRTPPEKRVFLVLSAAAGFGEEAAYRGFAITALASVTGSPGLSLAITSASFGLVHVYQGGIGVARTGLLGGLLGIPFLTTGSLVPSMIGHALLDVVGGLFLGDKLLGPDPSNVDAEPSEEASWK